MNLSASMIVDKAIAPRITAFKTRHPSVWVPDSRSTKCYDCKAVFGMLTRKHHCRICGRIFCYQCSSFTTTAVSYLDKWCKQTVKMCKSCYESQEEAKTVEAHILALAGMPLTMKEKWKCRLISKNWNKAWTHFSEVRHVQYKLPYNPYNRIEKLWMESNGHEMSGHSRLMIAYANAFGTLPPYKHHNYSTSCRYLMCSSQCTCYLSDSDILELIAQNVHVEKTEKRPSWMVPWVVMSGKYECSIEYLMEMKVAKRMDLYEDAVAGLPLRQKQRWFKMCSLFATVNKIIQYSDKDQRRKIKNELFEQNIIVQYPMDKRIILDIKSDEMIVIESNSRPVILPFVLSDKTVKNILIKNEDIRNDRLAQVTLMWISKLSGIQTSTYPVIPTSDKSGWVEIFDDCTTLYDIKYVKQTTIMDYIMEHNPTKTAYAIKTKFIKSVAISCVLSYILGLGDRHLENIIVTNNGELLHIDFGFLFGEDPHGVPSEMRITKQTLEALGGMNSSSFQIFSDQCEKIYTKVRKAAPLWYALFKHRGEEMANKWVGERLIPGEFDTASATKIVDIVHRNSSTSWVQHILDTSRVMRKTLKKLGR